MRAAVIRIPALRACFPSARPGLSRSIRTSRTSRTMAHARKPGVCSDDEFDAFLAASGSRPFFLAGHSQGAVMVKKLLEARFGDESLRRRLVGCYAPGLALFANVAPPLPLATEPGAVGTLACVERRGSFIVSNGHSMPRAGWNCAAEHAAFEHTVVGSLCGGYRPLTALPGLDAAGEGTHLGCFGWGAFFVQVFYTEACAKVAVRDGLLRIVGDKNALAYYATGTGCMHKWDFHLLWLDVRKNAVAQLANYEKETAAASETLFEAAREMEAISFEKKHLVQQWKSSLVGMARRDEALQIGSMFLFWMNA